VKLVFWFCFYCVFCKRPVCFIYIALLPLAIGGVFARLRGLKPEVWSLVCGVASQHPLTHPTCNISGYLTADGDGADAWRISDLWLSGPY
jgi:hypothetical protein